MPDRVQEEAREMADAAMKKHSKVKCQTHNADSKNENESWVGFHVLASAITLFGSKFMKHVTALHCGL